MDGTDGRKNALLSTRELVEKYGLMAKKALGQNFLLDGNITDKIMRLSLAAQGRKDLAGETVAEVGPGPGGLTQAVLQQKPEKLTAIEMDERCLEILGEINDSLVELNTLYREILMVTGPSPDRYRDYNFKESIPDVIEGFGEQHEKLVAVRDEIEDITGSNSSYISILNTLIYELDLLHNDPVKIATHLDLYKSNLGSLGTWLLSATAQPLLFDKITVFGEEKTETEESNFFENILFNCPQSYKYSDFISISDMSEDEIIRHPECETIGGYIKTIIVEADKQKWWDEDVSDDDKEFIKSLPYFDAEIFYECVGIRIK